MTTPERPNILLISMDDAFAFWRFRNAFGVELQTPNLDRICARATAFHAAYCQTPVCGPSRSSFMSGLAPHQTGIFDNYSEIFELLRPEQIWSYRLKEAGYFCSTGGKIHHGYKPRPPEVHNALYSHEAQECHFGPSRTAPHKDFGGAGRGLGTTDEANDSQYYDHTSADYAIDFLRRYDGDAPFYREAGFHNPHPPFRTPARFKEMYDENDFIMPEEWKQKRESDAFAEASFPPNFPLKNETAWRKTIRNYFSCYSHVDWHIGRVWDALQASPHAKNTLVIITADHGYHMGDKARFRKYTLWEEAAGVPLIIYDPRQDKGQVVKDPVALLDIGQTVMDYAQLPPLQDSPGRSLRPQVEGAVQDDRSVPTFFFGSAGIRHGQFRYIYYQDGSEKLYDLESDPWQLRDVSPNHPKLSEMRMRLKQTASQYGMFICDDETCEPPPTEYVSVQEHGKQPASPPTSGQIAFEPPDPNMPDYPGWRRYFLRPRKDMSIDLPNAWRELYYPGDIGDKAEHLEVRCNDLGCHIDFMGGHQRIALRIFGGRGNDRIETAHDPITAYLQAGDNTVEAGFANATIVGGSGYDRIECQRAENCVHGGTGDAHIICGTGHDIITTGDGRNIVHGNTGTSDVTIDGGTNVIEVGPGDMVLHFQRTGLPQVVKGYKGGELDISDWNALGPYDLSSDGRDALLTCGTERVRFVATDVAVLRQALADIE